MGIIQCAENCKYQKDGYCFLENCSTVATIDNDCPHFVKKSFNDGDCLFETCSTDKF